MKWTRKTYAAELVQNCMTCENGHSDSEEIMPKRRRQKLRGEMKKVLGNLDRRWVRAASVELSKQLDALIEKEFPDSIEKILAWTSFFPGEVDLSHFISKQLEKREVYLPRSSTDFEMTFVGVGKDWSTQVEQGQFGIPEPALQSGDLLQTDDGAEVLVVVPGIAFDRSGNRLGRGKGYYDRFLSRPELQRAKKVGVLWQLQYVESIPIEPHDVPMDWLCFEDSSVQVALSGSEELSL